MLIVYAVNLKIAQFRCNYLAAGLSALACRPICIIIELVFKMSVSYF